MRATRHFNCSLLTLALASATILSVTPAVAADPEVEALYKEGLYLRETGKTFSAIEALEALLQSQPTLQRVRLELAVAYYRALNYERAKAEAQTVLDDPKTPENVKLAIIVFLAQIEKDHEDALNMKHKVEPFVSVGLVYDTNVNAGPDSDVLPGGLTLTSGTAEKDWGYTLQAGVGHTYQSPTPVRIGEMAARYLWKSQASLYHRGYKQDHDYNLSVATLATGPAWQVTNKWRGNVSLQADKIWQGGDGVALFLSGLPSVTWQFKDSELTLDGLLSKRNFENDLRDSTYKSVGLSYGRLFKNGKIAGQIGAKRFDENADDPIYTNDGYEWFVGANFLAWPNGNVYARYAQRRADYEDAVIVTDREDKEQRYEIGFGHQFKEGKLAQWSLNGSFIYTNNVTDETIYDYNRHQVSMSLGRSF